MIHAAQKGFITVEISSGLWESVAAYIKREGIEYLNSFADDFDTTQGIT